MGDYMTNRLNELLDQLTEQNERIKKLKYQPIYGNPKDFPPGTRLVTLQNLQNYHETLMRYLSDKTRMIPTNICSQCGGLIGENNTCDFCGTKYKLVLDKEDQI